MESFNKWVDKLKNDTEITCIEHIIKKKSKYIACLNLINKMIESGEIIDNELANAVRILFQIISEADSSISFSKTGFRADEGQDRTHTHSIRYLVVSKIKDVYYKDCKGNLVIFPINKSNSVDLDTIQILKNEYVISFETYISKDNLRNIKLAIIDEDFNNHKKVKQYDFIVDAYNKKIKCKLTKGLFKDKHYSFQADELLNLYFIEKIIDYEAWVMYNDKEILK